MSYFDIPLKNACNQRVKQMSYDRMIVLSLPVENLVKLTHVMYSTFLTFDLVHTVTWVSQVKTTYSVG